MGTIKQGILGDFSGKVGNVIGYKRNGVNYLRAQAACISNPRTKEQQKQREKFSAAMCFLKAVNPFIRIGYKNYTQGRTAYNTALSYLLKRAIVVNGEQKEINFKQAMVSIGFLMPVFNASAKYDNNKMIFQWEDNSGTGNAEATDVAMLLVYNKEKGISLYNMIAATRADSFAQIDLPEEWGKNTLIPYLSFTSTDGEEVANSICLI
ncbi:MAG: DUF6266 family protein [Bacteroides sp.]|jgi:hypothetical protein|nr:DUF6266 family protein [Bacteroides sp.]MCI1682185.1 DUF6266 family protein [Bacteroides sp.]